MKIDDFLNIEKKYDLYHLEIDSICPWTYFRMQFWNYEICQDLLALSNHINTDKKKLYIRQIKTLLGLIFRKNKKYIHPTDFVFLSHERRIKVGNNFECIYTDELVKKYSNSVVLERPYQGQHLSPVSIDNVYYMDMLSIKAGIFYLFHYIFKTNRYRGIYKTVQKFFAHPLEEIGVAYHYPIQYKNVYKSLTKIVLQFSLTRKDIKKLFEKMNPKVIVETVGYSRFCMLFNEIAREKGVSTIELQHGTMHAAHAAYQFADECGEIKYFPQYVFVFSEYWKKCAHLPIPEEHIKVTGYPYFERQLNYYRSIHNKVDKVNIIFVSQGTIGKELSKLAADLCDLIDEKTYHIIYKLHPGEYVGWKERTPWLVKNNIEVVDSLEHNIYEYFAKSSIQVGVYSTAIYEGLGFGLKTYIYNIGHADTMDTLCEQGYASYVNNAQELFNRISLNSDTEQDGKQFWKMNSIDNICHEIDQLLASARKEDKA